MRKILAWCLLIVMMLCLAGCGEDQPTQTVEGFRAGYSRVCVNPQGQIPLVGYSNVQFRWCTQIIDNVYSTAVALSDGEETIVLINADLVVTTLDLVETVKKAIHAQTGLPEENIILSGTHSHSLPDYGTTTIPEVAEYRLFLIDQIVLSATEAVQDLKPATLSVGSIEAENLNFVRHYQMSDGSVISDNHGTSQGKTYLGHSTQADPTLHVAKISRPDSKDIIMCNWRAHPHFTGGASLYDLSSDYVGPFREGVEDLTGANFLFLQGAAGNINEKSRMIEENRTTDYRTYGAILANYAVECLENNMTEVSGDTLKVKTSTIYGQIDTPDTSLYYLAKSVNAVFKSTGNATQAMALVTDGSIQSVYHASSVVSNYPRTTENDGKMNLTAVVIGDSFAFVTFPGEAYDSISVRVEENSPYAMTMFVGYCNGHIGYVPDEYAFTYGCYETDITRFVRGTDNVIVDAYKELLHGIQNQ